VEFWAGKNVNLLEGERVKLNERANLVVGWYLGFNENLSYDIQVDYFSFPGAALDNADA